MYSNIKITKILYKDNFMGIYGIDLKNKTNAYIVLQKGLGDHIYLKVGNYSIYYGGDGGLGVILSKLVYKVILK